MQQAAAYDLDTFAVKQTVRRRPLHLAQPVPKKAGISAYKHALGVILAGALFLSLVCGVLYSQATLTAVGAQIDAQNEALISLKSDYTYYSSQLEMKTSLKNVEEYATGRLGLVKLDASQMVYIQRGEAGHIDYAGTMLSRMFGAASPSTMCMLTAP